MFLEYLMVAFLMVRSRPVRAALSWLGIYIGVLSLVLILALHAGARQELDNLYRTEGARVVVVRPQLDRESFKMGRLSFDDVRRIEEEPGVLSVLPRMDDERSVRSEKGNQQQVRVMGIDDAFISLYRIPVTSGRVFLPREVATRQAVCLITREAVKTLFPFSNPMGARINIQGSVYIVIGIVEWSPQISQRVSSYEEPALLIPATWFLKKETDAISLIEVRVRPDWSSEQAVAGITRALTRGDANRARQYTITTLEQNLEKRKKFSERALYTLLAIAAVSLLVGGIGIANVMLTSVTERTREVGIRKALGATRRDILFQFLVEASFLCAGGGMMAVLSGWIGIAAWLYFYPGVIPVAVPWLPMGVCLALTLLIGVIAGLYPASRAASLSPAEALRYE